MWETDSISKWPVEVIRAVNHSLDLGIQEERDKAVIREDLLRDTQEVSQGLLDIWLNDLDLSQKKLESLMEAKAAIVGALRIVENDMKFMSN